MGSSVKLHGNSAMQLSELVGHEKVPAMDARGGRHALPAHLFLAGTTLSPSSFVPRGSFVPSGEVYEFEVPWHGMLHAHIEGHDSHQGDALRVWSLREDGVTWGLTSVRRFSPAGTNASVEFVIYWRMAGFGFFPHVSVKQSDLTWLSQQLLPSFGSRRTPGSPQNNRFRVSWTYSPEMTGGRINIYGEKA